MKADELSRLLGSLERREISRRQFMQRALLGGLTLASASALVAACGGGEVAETSAPPATEGATTPATGETAATGEAAGGPKRGGVALVSYSDAQTTDKQDPAQVVTSFEIFMAGMVYDRLTRLDLQFNPLPGLAESWEPNDDASQWTFYLHSGVEWHDGRLFTSKDVAYSMKRILDPEVGSAGLAVLEPVFDASGIATPDDKTIVFSLKSPHVYLPVLLGGYFAWIVPDGETDFSKQIGTGPFISKSFQAGASFEAERNPNYWDSGKPYLDGVRVAIIQEQATKLQSVLAGDADIGDAIEYSAVPAAQQASDAEILAAPGGNFGPIVAAAKEEPFTDQRVRRALKLALDRQKIVDTVFFGQAEVSADIPVSPDDPLYPGFDPFPYDPAEARSLLKEAGYGNGLDLTLFTSQVSPGLVDTAVLYKETAAEAGINVDVQNWPPATYWDQIWLHRPFVMSFWLRVHPSQLLPQLFSTGAAWNEAQFENAEFDSLVVQAQGTVDEQERKALYEQALRLVNDDSGEIVPCHAARVWVKKKHVNGLKLDWASAGDMSEVSLA